MSRCGFKRQMFMREKNLNIITNYHTDNKARNGLYIVLCVVFKMR